MRRLSIEIGVEQLDADLALYGVTLAVCPDETKPEVIAAVLRHAAASLEDGDAIERPEP